MSFLPASRSAEQTSRYRGSPESRTPWCDPARRSSCRWPGWRPGSASGEGAIEVDLDKADLLAALVQVIDGLLSGVAAGAHGDDDAVGVRGAHVVKQLVVAAVSSPTSFMTSSTMSGWPDSTCWQPRGLEVDVRGSGPCRSDADARGLSARSRKALTLSHGTSFFISSYSMPSIFWIRGRCGSRRRSAGRARRPSARDTWATSAMSIASCTLLEASMAKPVCGRP